MEQLEHPEITYAQRYGTPHRTPLQNSDGILEFVELSEEDYAEIIYRRYAGKEEKNGTESIGQQEHLADGNGRDYGARRL